MSNPIVWDAIASQVTNLYYNVVVQSLAIPQINDYVSACASHAQLICQSSTEMQAFMKALTKKYATLTKQPVVSLEDFYVKLAASYSNAKLPSATAIEMSVRIIASCIMRGRDAAINLAAHIIDKDERADPVRRSSTLLAFKQSIYATLSGERMRFASLVQNGKVVSEKTYDSNEIAKLIQTIKQLALENAVLKSKLKKMNDTESVISLPASTSSRSSKPSEIVIEEPVIEAVTTPPKITELDPIDLPEVQPEDSFSNSAWDGIELNF